MIWEEILTTSKLLCSTYLKIKGICSLKALKLNFKRLGACTYASEDAMFIKRSWVLNWVNSVQRPSILTSWVWNFEWTSRFKGDKVLLELFYPLTIVCGLSFPKWLLYLHFKDPFLNFSSGTYGSRVDEVWQFVINIILCTCRELYVDTELETVMLTATRMYV